MRKLKRKFDFSRLAQSATEPDEDHDDVTSGGKKYVAMKTTKDAIVTSRMSIPFDFR